MAKHSAERERRSKRIRGITKADEGKSSSSDDEKDEDQHPLSIQQELRRRRRTKRPRGLQDKQLEETAWGQVPGEVASQREQPTDQAMKEEQTQPKSTAVVPADTAVPLGCLEDQNVETEAQKD